MTMSREEKRALARKVLRKHGYTEEEIEKILRLAFDKKGKKGD